MVQMDRHILHISHYIDDVGPNVQKKDQWVLEIYSFNHNKTDLP